MSLSPSPVLVTGAFGNVGRHTVQALLEAGRTVVATDLRTPLNERLARRLDDRVELRWADLTDPATVTDLVHDIAPEGVVHLAAIIPPGTYVLPDLARRVNVDAVRHVVEAVEGLDRPCRLLFASSIATYGSRNPHTMPPVDAETPTLPRELYGAHKVEAEGIIRGSRTDWAILRLGAVVFHDMSLAMDLGSIRLEALLPTDGRVHAVDGRDVARAFVSALDAPCSGRTLLIGGDDSHRMTQREFAVGISAAAGLRGAIPEGRPGDPTDDTSWFAVDWMDTTEAQGLLGFQQVTWEQTLADLGAHVGIARHALPLAAPLVRVLLGLRSPHRGTPAGPARPWAGIAAEWGEDRLVTPSATED